MGGKSKQAHRTKNNVRPSSSGRSAELLGAGAGSLRAAAALFPSLAAVAVAPDAALLPDLALAMKKLNKKDPITKCKALQELSELVQSHKLEELEPLLPHWALLYRALAVDPDRKVRELTQTCHGHIVSACGRRVAPHLKALLPAWLQAQHDDFAPAQARAHHSLHSTFPGNKLPEAISFCRAEILQHLVDNLLDSDAAVSKKLEQSEEREAARARVAAAALAGLRYVCGALPAAHGDWLWERLAPLLKAHAFWKLANHPLPELRAAWYGAAGALATRFGAQPQWAGAGAGAGGHGARALRVLAGARESGAAAGAAWQALLCLITNDPEWYDRLEKKDLVMTRLLETLEGGGWGDARALAELLPRLLAALPPAALPPAALPPAALGAGGAGRLFAACFAGLGRRGVLLSPRERQAWLAAVGAAIRHVAARSEVGSEAAAGAVRQWLQTALAARSEPLVRESAHCLAALLRHWTTAQPGAELLVRGLWQALASTAGAQLAQLAEGGPWGCGRGRGDPGGGAGAGAGGEAEADALRHLLGAHVLLLLTLRAALLQEPPKKRRGIRFEDEPAAEDAKSHDTAANPQLPTEDSASVRLHHHHLEEAAQRVVASYLEFAGTSGRVDVVLEGLLPLLRELGSRDLWTGVGRALCGAGPGAGPSGVWERALRPWLCGGGAGGGAGGGGGGGGGEALVDVTLLLLPHLGPEAQADVFAAVDRAGEPVSECVVRKCIRGGGGGPAEGWARGWVRGAGARAAVLRLLARALRGDAAAARDVADCIGDRGTDEEPPAGADTLSAVLEAAGAALAPPAPAPAAAAPAAASAPAAARVCAELLARAGPAPGPAPAGDSFDQLVLALFRYDLHSQVESDEVEESVVRSSWRGGLRVLPPARAELIVNSAVSLIKEYINVDTTDLQTGRMKHAATAAALLAEFRPAAGVARDVTGPADAGAEARAAVGPHALRSACLAGRLSCPFADAEPARSMLSAAPLPDRALVLRHGRECVLRGALLRAWAATPHFEGLVDMFAELLYDCAIVTEMSEGYAFWSGYDVIERIQADLDGIVDEIVAAAAGSARAATRAALRRRAACDGHWWAWAHARYRLRLGGAAAAGGADAGGGEVDHDLTGDGFFHTLQAELINDPSDAARYAARYGAVARCLLALEPALAEAASSREPDPDLLINAYYRRNDILLFDTDVPAVCAADADADAEGCEREWLVVVCTAGACDFLAALVELRGWDAPAHVWDFATIALASVLGSLRRAKLRWGELPVSLLLSAAARLHGAVCTFVARVPAEAERRAPSAHVAALPREWADVFEPEVGRCIYDIVLHVLESTEQADDVPISASHTRALSALCGAVRRAPYKGAAAGAAAGAGGQTAPLERLASAAAGVLGRVAPHAHKYLAFYTLQALTDPLVLHDAEKLREWSASSEGGESGSGGGGGGGGGGGERPSMALDWTRPALARAAPLLDAALAHVRPAEGVCELLPHSDSHSLALGYLLLVAGVGGLAARARGDLALHYTELVRAHALAEPALTAALRLLPAGVCEYAADPSSSAAPPRGYSDAFLTIKEFSIDEPPRSCDVSLLACRALYVVVGGAGGGAARSWWGAAEARAARAFARLVAAYVTPPLVRDQLRGVHARRSEVEDSEVSVHWSAGEVTCALLVDDRKVELTIALAKDHPLTLPKISTTSQAGGAGGSTQWLCVYLAYQQGSLLGALKLWAAAVSARVDAARPCYICYCRLQPASGRLPSALCHQCRNKFHPECLRKWFTTSNKSNCPLCRASF